eukprot:7765409-Ditylum_brightwellii.AAC.1
MNIADVFIIPSMLLVQEVRQRMEVNATERNMESFLSDVEDDNMGNPIGSDVEADEDECGESEDDECRIHCQNVPCLNRNVIDTNTEGKGEVDGALWKKILTSMNQLKKAHLAKCI